MSNCCGLPVSFHCFKCKGHLSNEEHYNGQTICGNCIANFVVAKTFENDKYYDSIGKQITCEQYRNLHA